MLTIFKYTITGPHTDPSMFFDINGQEYKSILNHKPGQHVDITAVHTHPALRRFITEIESTIAVNLDIFHNYENQHRVNFDVARSAPANCYIITNTYTGDNAAHENIIYNDFLFNGIKAYYSQYPFDINTHLWNHSGLVSHIIPSLTNGSNKSRIFISLIKTYAKDKSRNLKFRKLLLEKILSKHADKGYVGNKDDNKDLILYAQSDFPTGTTIDELTRCRLHSRQGHASPIHNEYFTDTFISIYGETIETSDAVAITEKTYVPLIKGHFILPFSTTGYLSKLTSKGFKLPDFIDYRYDGIVDDDARYAAFSSEVDRLLSFSLDEWRQLWKDNLDIIQFNRRLFHELPYDRIDLNEILKKHT